MALQLPKEHSLIYYFIHFPHQNIKQCVVYGVAIFWKQKLYFISCFWRKLRVQVEGKWKRRFGCLFLVPQKGFNL